MYMSLRRLRYYIPLLTTVLYTVVVYFCVYYTTDRFREIRNEKRKSEALRQALARVKEPWRSPSYGIVAEIKYLWVDDEEPYISPYDDLFLEVSHEFGTDWRMMSAIAYHESRFRPYAESYSGAVGMMQIMPRTAAIFGVTPEELVNPEVNIRVANIYYNDIIRMLSLPDTLNFENKASLILASYNGGVGRIFDAQRLARAEGDDPYNWRALRRHMIRLRDPNYYNLPIVRGGYFHMVYQTLKYVEIVMERYHIYCEKTSDSRKHLLYPFSHKEISAGKRAKTGADN